MVVSKKKPKEDILYLQDNKKLNLLKLRQNPANVYRKNSNGDTTGMKNNGCF